jgi:farnesyl diphosphate synthase
MSKNLSASIKEYSNFFEDNFKKVIDEIMPSGPEKRVVEAMKYSVLNGGKRLRPFLVMKTSELFGVEKEKSIRTAVALEMLHSYSLIHDDLPAMDNDDLRRGKPTCHKAFDEATAILAGDGLLTYVFEVLVDERTNKDANIRCELIKCISSAAGAKDGMIAGQMLDLYAEKLGEDKCDSKLVENIEVMKTGRLLRYACEAGAILGNASVNERDALIKYSRKIGMAFQIADDILDIEGDQELVGKTLRKDQEQGKVTFVSLYGIERAKEMSMELIEDAIDIISVFGDKSEILKELARFIITRKH